jgi:hypothetical protein
MLELHGHRGYAWSEPPFWQCNLSACPMWLQASILHRLVSDATPQSERKELRQKSTHLVPSALWGFFGGYTDYGSSTLAVGVDSLHADDLGVYLKLVRFIADVLGSLPGGGWSGLLLT